MKGRIQYPTLVYRDTEGNVIHSEMVRWETWKVRAFALQKTIEQPHNVYIEIRSNISKYKISRCLCRIPTFNYSTQEYCEKCGERTERLQTSNTPYFGKKI